MEGLGEGRGYVVGSRWRVGGGGVREGVGMKDGGGEGKGRLG